MKFLYMHSIWTTIMVAVVFDVSSQTPSYVPPDGLVGWWDMTPENLEEVDANNVSGVHVPNRIGELNAALQFSQGGGNCAGACVGVSVDMDEETEGEFSFAMWVKPTRSITMKTESSTCYPNPNGQLLFANQNWAMMPKSAAGANYGVGLSIGTNGLIAAEHASNLLVSRLSHDVQIDEFVHVVVVYTTDTARMYLDGTLVRERELPCSSHPRHLTSESANSQLIQVSLAHGRYSPPFNGIIDDFGFWNRTLSNSEISQLYNSYTVQGCTDFDACNYSPDATDDDGSCGYAEAGYACDGTCLTDTDNDGVCDEFEVAGCQDAAACNFYEIATDPAPCVFPPFGLTECGDGGLICGEGTTWDIQTQTCVSLIEVCPVGTNWNAESGSCVPYLVCPGDFNDDGQIGAADLLEFLSLFGQPCSAQ